MSIMKLNWGARIAILYGGFVAIIVVLVVASVKQDFDLVAPDYYEQEIQYQDVLDANRNEVGLSGTVNIHANENTVFVSFPVEFDNKAITGNVQFYSPVNSSWDKNVAIKGSKLEVPRTQLHNTRYIVKMRWMVDGVSYYRESEINLHQ